MTNADESTRRISDAGGEMLAPPFDVFDSGRMAVVKDPTGAVLSLWQPRKHPGATWGTDPGAMLWNELLTRDTATASQFYARAFGWAAEAQAGPVAVHRVQAGGAVGRRYDDHPRQSGRSGAAAAAVLERLLRGRRL